LAGMAAGAAALGAGALLAGAARPRPDVETAGGAAIAGPDTTHHHPHVSPAEPKTAVEGANPPPPYVALPEEQPSADFAGFAPLAVDASTVAHDATDAHPHAPHAGLVADVEANPTHPVYVDLPPETYVPPIVAAPAGESGEGALGVAGIA